MSLSKIKHWPLRTTKVWADKKCSVVCQMLSPKQ